MWQALVACGLKQQLSWNDALREATSIAASDDHQQVARQAADLFRYVEGTHQQMMPKGSLPFCLRALEKLAWVPAQMPQEPKSRLSGHHPQTKLQKLSELFPKHFGHCRVCCSWLVF